MSLFHDAALPSSWTRTDLGKLLLHIEAGASFKCDERPPEDGEVGVVKVSAVTWGEYDEQESKTVTDSSRIEERFLISSGDLLFSRANTISLVGACVIARRVTKRLMLSDKILRLRPHGVDARWILYFLRSTDGRYHIERLSTGNQESMRNIGQDRIRSIPIPVAPRAEQDRIVAAIEQHLSDIDAGVAALDRALINLKRYRAAVLKDACEGRLVTTEAEIARKEGREYEPAEVLLQRILKERRVRWEANQLAKMKAKGQTPSDERWKARYEEPPRATESETLEIPEGWIEAPLGSIAGVQLGQQRAPLHTSAEVTYPYIRAGNITWQGLDLSDVKQMGFPDPIRYRLEPGDILLSEASGSPSEVGKPAIWRGEIPDCCYQKTLLRVRTYASGLTAEWLHMSFMRDAVLGRFAKMAPGVGILHLTAERMLEWPVRFPPLAEQHRIVAEVDRLLSVADTTEQAIRAQLARARRLRQAVLKRAFEGKLVPQEASDEPASVQAAPLQQPSPEHRPQTLPRTLHLVQQQPASLGEMLREFRRGQRLSPQAFASRFDIEVELVAELEALAIPFEPDQVGAMRKTVGAALPSLGVGDIKLIMDELVATQHSPTKEEDRITHQAARKSP